jgi:hypothetical protein
MEQIYYYLGATIFWIVTALGLVGIIGWMLIVLYDTVMQKLNIGWLVVSFVRHRKEYLKYLKEKKCK